MQTLFQRSRRSLFAAIVATGLFAGTTAAHADDPYNSSPLIANWVAARPAGALAPAAAAAPAVAVSNSTQTATIAAAAPAPEPESRAKSAQRFLANVANKAGEVVSGALNMIGVRYKWGGNTPDSGLDCSGFVRYVFQDTLGFMLPRRAEEMSHVGERVAKNDLKPGDLVFFNTMRRTASHVGIYVGDNKFIHAPATGGKIRVEDIRQAYWSNRFNGARRIEQLTSAPDLTRVEQIFRQDHPL